MTLWQVGADCSLQYGEWPCCNFQNEDEVECQDSLQLTMSTKELFQCEKMNADLQMKNKGLARKRQSIWRA